VIKGFVLKVLISQMDLINNYLSKGSNIKRLPPKQTLLHSPVSKNPRKKKKRKKLCTIENWNHMSGDYADIGKLLFITYLSTPSSSPSHSCQQGDSIKKIHFVRNNVWD
jgi:hypothetical protein